MIDRPIKKVLIANRGEIAMRVQRACEELGLESVCVCSDADEQALFIRKAKDYVVLGPAAPSESYLNIDRLLSAAKSKNCDAVHPGYGFLSENADFAERVVKEGLTFIGPSAESMRIMGSKTRARTQVEAHGVPCTPGTPAGLSEDELVQRAVEIGYPVLLKAVAGGGGRGMRVARDEHELRAGIPRAQAEAKKNFGNADVYLEKFIERPRHVEVQVFGDSQGNILHFGTRDCSIQRRHQKLVEEAPAPGLEPVLREKIHQAAIAAAKSVDYVGAGTVEFLVKDSEFYFLEMNTRIQVEHPVTEEISGTDLVQLQIQIAQGKPLPMTQEEVRFKGHAIEFRLYAEDVEHDFRPATGVITTYQRPDDLEFREEYSFEQGDKVLPHYDAMLSKIVILAPSREAAIEKSLNILKGFRVEGLPTSLPFFRWLLGFTPFKREALHIEFVEQSFGPEQLRQLQASEVRDPRHQQPVGGAEVKNTYHYKSQKFGTTYTIEIIHRRDGCFLAIPMDAQGRRARNKDCRLSNGLDTVMSSLIADVLEQTPPNELFEG